MAVAVFNLERADRPGDGDQDRTAQILRVLAHLICGDRIANQRVPTAKGEGHGNRIARRIQRGDGNDIGVVVVAPVDVIDAEGEVFHLILHFRTGHGGKAEVGAQRVAIAVTTQIDQTIGVKGLTRPDITSVIGVNFDARVVVAGVGEAGSDLHFAGGHGHAAGDAVAVAALRRPAERFGTAGAGALAVPIDQISAAVAGHNIIACASLDRVVAALCGDGVITATCGDAVGA